MCPNCGKETEQMAILGGVYLCPDCANRLAHAAPALLAACEALIRQWEEDAGEVLAWQDDDEPDSGGKAMLDCARDLRRAITQAKPQQTLPGFYHDDDNPDGVTLARFCGDPE